MAKRIVFLGTPSYACPALEHLTGRPDTEVVLVVTQPDRPAGRGRRLQAPSVKSLALDLGLPLHQTATLRDASSRAPLVAAAPDLIVVAAFGLILGRSILSLPPLGCVNLHASLLPRYRGANPVAAAIRNGDRSTGVSLMRMERGLDTGAVYDWDVVDITHDDTTDSLTERLSHAGARVLERRLPDLLVGTAIAEEQGTGATCTRPMVKDDGWVDWSGSALEIERHVRAMWPWPRAWTTLPNGTRLQVHAARVIPGNLAGPPGSVVHAEGTVLVQCGSGALQLDRVQLAGGKPADRSVLLERIVTAADGRLGAVDAPTAQRALVVACDE